MTYFDVFSLLECKRRKSRSHGKRKKIVTLSAKTCAEKRINTSLKDLSIALKNHGRNGLLLWFLAYLSFT